MKLYYVEHSVVTTESYAINAKDDEHLKQIIADREKIFKGAPFDVKYKRDKTGKIESHELHNDWDLYDYYAQPAWVPKLGR